MKEHQLIEGELTKLIYVLRNFIKNNSSQSYCLFCNDLFEDILGRNGFSTQMRYELWKRGENII